MRIILISQVTCCYKHKNHIQLLQHLQRNLSSRCVTQSPSRHFISGGSTLSQYRTERRLCSDVQSAVIHDDNNDISKTEKPVNRFVPQCAFPSQSDFDLLQDFVQRSKRLIVLTGAGLSTESGIPDYRSEGVGLYARSTNRPVNYSDFVQSADIRQRYWARNYVGWPTFGYFLPNNSHIALYRWEYFGKLSWLVTQNVDALHFKAGSRKVTELHGSAHHVICLNCTWKVPRPEMQDIISAHNPDWSAESNDMTPDADVALTPEQIQGFKVPPCPNCGGNLKPEIVFFGDNVKKDVVKLVHQKVRDSDAMLIAGSSLHVYSGYRFALAAKEQGKPVAILNIGPTRADKLADLKIDAKCGDILPKIQLR